MCVGCHCTSFLQMCWMWGLVEEKMCFVATGDGVRVRERRTVPTYGGVHETTLMHCRKPRLILSVFVCFAMDQCLSRLCNRHPHPRHIHERVDHKEGNRDWTTFHQQQPACAQPDYPP